MTDHHTKERRYNLSIYRDPKKISIYLESWIMEHISGASAKGAVLGISGGIDSAVLAGLLCRAVGPENGFGENRQSAGSQNLGLGTIGERKRPFHHPTAESDAQNRLDGGQPTGHQIGVSHDRTGTHAQKYSAHPGAGLDHHAENAWHIPCQPSTQPGEPRPGHPPATGENRATPDRATGINAALATLERYTRELGTALVALERLVERQIERLHERERQRSRGLGLGR